MKYPPLPDGISIRELRYADYQQVRSFECANSGEPWTADVQELIRSRLLRVVSDNDIESLVLVATTAADEVVGINATIRLNDSSGMAENWLLAVKHGYRRQKIGLNLKLEAMSRAQRAWGTVVGFHSMVNLNNHPMTSLNQHWLGAASEPDTNDPEEFLATVVVYES